MWEQAYILTLFLLKYQLVESVLFYQTKHDIEVTNEDNLELKWQLRTKQRPQCFHTCLDWSFQEIERLVMSFQPASGDCKCLLSATETLAAFEDVPKLGTKTFMYHRELFPRLGVC